MLLSKRLFPHPVLRSTPHNDYKESLFKLAFEENKVDQNNKLAFKSLQFVTNNDRFRQMVQSGLVNVYIHLECSNTLYRELILLSLEPIDFEINKKDLNGKLFITAFAVAASDIKDYFDEDFNSDYELTHFNIDKYDIMAFDDGYSIDVIHDVDKDDKINSIFVVVPKEDNQADGVEYVYQGNKIIIKMPHLSYNQYDRLKYIKRYQNLFFSLFAIPILAMSLNELKKTSFDDLDVQYRWFLSVKKAYKDINSQDLNEESFEKLDTFKFAQLVFNGALVKTVDDLYHEGSNLEEEMFDEED